MTREEPYCTETSHPPVFRDRGQQTLYKKVAATLAAHEAAGASHDDLGPLLVEEFGDVFAKPSDYVGDGIRVQGLRRQIASDWGEVLYKLENAANLTGWCILKCIRDGGGGELHVAQGLLLLEAIRNVLATINQLRSGLAADTLGYVRTVHEVHVKSEFLEKHRTKDEDLPGKFLFYTNTKYLRNYQRFSPSTGTADTSEAPWSKSDEYYRNRFEEEGKGDYGWAYPNLVSRRGNPKEKPTLRDLMENVGLASPIDDMYYTIFSSDVHAQLIMGKLIDRPARVGVIGFNSFSMGGVDSILRVLVPMFKGILDNTTSSCVIP